MIQNLTTELIDVRQAIWVNKIDSLAGMFDLPGIRP